MKNWKSYCETTYNSLRANVHNWGKPEFARPITRIYYIGVFDTGNPNPTGFISEAAYHNKVEGKKTVNDHYLSPQFIGRMILDNPDKYLSDFAVFQDLFWKSCATIIVTADENIQLSSLTVNDGLDYSVKVPTDQKYDHVGIKLYQRQSNKKLWKYCHPTTEKPDVPPSLLDYERQFLA